MAQYIATEREEYHKKLQLTLRICSLNVDTGYEKVIKLQRDLDKAIKELGEHRKTLEIVEEKLRDFYGSLEGNVKKV